MEKFLHKDSWTTGIVVGLLSEALTGLLLWGICAALTVPLRDHLSWLGVVFIPVLLILRYYTKNVRHLNTTKSLITVLFVTFVLYMYLLISTHSALVTQPF